jgi:hypothetical protein
VVPMISNNSLICVSLISFLSMVSKSNPAASA